MKYPNIKAELARKGLSAQDLAEKIGVTSTTFSFWMNGRSEPSISKAIAIAEILGCDVLYLFDPYRGE